MNWTHWQSPFQVLGIEQTACLPTITSAYKRLIEELHPDRIQSPEAFARFNRICEAFALLTDPDKRRDYEFYFSRDPQLAAMSRFVVKSTSEQRPLDAPQEEASWKYDLLSETQFDLILKLQKQVNGIITPHIRWDILFLDADLVTPSKGNASLLIDYLLDLEALGRGHGSRWDQLQTVGICDFEALDLASPQIAGSAFEVRDWFASKSEFTKILQSYAQPYLKEASDGARRRLLIQQSGAILRDACRGLPEVHEVEEFRFAAGRKVFALVEQYCDMIVFVFRATPERVDSLPDSRRSFSRNDKQGKGWVYFNVEFPLEEINIETLVAESYQLVALKRMLRAMEQKLKASREI